MSWNQLHDQEEAIEVADRIVVMDRGRIVQVGTPEDVYERPATSFVHDFIGESVVIPVSVAEGLLHFGGRRLDLDSQGVDAGAAQLFVRPADIAVGSPGDAPLQGRIKRVHGIGSARRLEIDLVPHHSIEIFAAGTQGLTVGDEIGLRPNRYRVYAAVD